MITCIRAYLINQPFLFPCSLTCSMSSGGWCSTRFLYSSAPQHFTQYRYCSFSTRFSYSSARLHHFFAVEVWSSTGCPLVSTVSVQVQLGLTTPVMLRYLFSSSSPRSTQCWYGSALRSRVPFHLYQVLRSKDKIHAQISCISRLNQVTQY